MNINFIKKLSGVPADRILIKEIVDEKIISRPYTMRIAEYILDKEGNKWSGVRGVMAATELLYKDQDIQFWLDGVRYDGFLADHPDLKVSFRQKEAALLFDVEVLFLKDE